MAEERLNLYARIDGVLAKTIDDGEGLDAGYINAKGEFVSDLDYLLKLMYPEQEGVQDGYEDLTKAQFEAEVKKLQNAASTHLTPRLADGLRDTGMKPEEFADLVSRQGRDQQFSLKVEGRPDIENPSETDIFEAVDALTPLGGPGFLVLEIPGGHYAQAAGGDGKYAVESREWLDDHFESFRHYAAGKEGDRKTYATIPTNRFQVTVQKNECLAASDVKQILSAFLHDGKRSARYEWRDISDHFEPAGGRTLHT